MKRLMLILSAFTMCWTMAVSPALATTIDFDSFGATYSGSVGAPFIIGDATFTGWSLALDSANPSNYLAFDFALGVGGFPMASITFDTPVYLNSFDFNTLASGVDISFDGAPPSNLTSNQLWANQTYPAGTKVQNIVFSSPTTEFVTTLNLDNINYSPVPIPGALCLLASALLGITGLRKRYFS